MHISLLVSVMDLVGMVGDSHSPADILLASLRFQVSSLVMIFSLRSAALLLSKSVLGLVVIGALYPISECGDDDISP